MSAAIGRALRIPAQTGVLALVLLALLIAAASVAASAGAVVPRASMADIQHQVMCVTCGIPLEGPSHPRPTASAPVSRR